MNKENPLLGFLRCPFCGDRLSYKYLGTDRFDNRYGLLISGCGEFPVIADIPILHMGVIGNRGESVQDVVAKIKSGEFEQALISMMVPTPNIPIRKTGKYKRAANVLINLVSRNKGVNSKQEIIDRSINRFIEICNEPTVEELLRFFFLENGFGKDTHFIFFFYRYGLPRHITTLGALPVINNTEMPILELGCGCGHITREILKRVNNSPVVGIDKSFFALFIAKKMMATEADFICYDVNNGIPFDNNAFYATIIVDGIHYIGQKFNAIREMKRVVSERGVIFLISSRNAKIQFKDAGFPLIPEGYSNLIGTLPHRIISDKDIVQSYLKNEGLNLEEQIPFEDLYNEPLLTIVASQDESVFRSYKLADNYTFLSNNPSLNPIYRPTETEDKDRLLLLRTMPPAYYENDSIDCSLYLPEKLYIDKKYYSGIKINHNYPLYRELLDKFVLLDLPDNYYKQQLY